MVGAGHPLRQYENITAGTRVSIEYSSVDFETVPEKRQYRVRIKEIDPDWRQSAKADTLDITFGKAGTYTFEVVAIDRDFNYSEPAGLTLTVVLPWYQNGWILYPSAGGIFILLVFSSVSGYRYYQERQQVLAYQQLAVSELQDARRVQMGLMPEVAPTVEGLEIAGRCVSANTVSGDFFDYLEGENEIAIVVGDVTGHGMQGAMNATLTDGVLRAKAEEMERFCIGQVHIVIEKVPKIVQLSKGLFQSKVLGIHA